MSNFNGFLIKFGDDVFPHHAIIEKSYDIYPNRRIDLDSVRVATGDLVRNVLDHTASTIQFSLKPMEGALQEQVSSFINSHYVNAKEKKVLVTYWCPDISNYKVGYFYIPDVQYKIKQIDEENLKIYYDETIIKLIEY